MPRGVSIHIGVNQPGGRPPCPTLQDSERFAWRMAGLAEQAGYNSVLLLRGEEATRSAVHDALTRAAGLLTEGDSLFVSFSGHGMQERDIDGDEGAGDGWDEGWRLADGGVIDDRLVAYWRLFERGVRIVVVADSCYGGGSMRGDEDVGCAAPASRVMRDGISGYRGPAGRSAANGAGPCIAERPHDTDGIQAGLLLLSSCIQSQQARESQFIPHLLDVWNDGAFQGTYDSLYQKVKQQVMMEHDVQRPHIQLLGTSEPAFLLETAFHLRPYRAARGSTVYR